MDEELAGYYGSELWEVDAAGKHIRLLEPPVAAVPGTNIRLTIDSRLQEAATNILEQTNRGDPGEEAGIPAQPDDRRRRSWR